MSAITPPTAFATSPLLHDILEVMTSFKARIRSALTSALWLWCPVLLLGAAHAVSGQSSSVLRIYLARHGQTDWNAEHRLQGTSDTVLNSTGREQAARLAERLRGLKIDAAYSSTLRRSRETADIVRGSVPLEPLAGLNERRLGMFEGRQVDATDPLTAREYARRSQEPDDTLDGGESLTQFFERVRATVTAIRAQHASGTILIVGHGGTNQMIVRALLDLSAQQAQSFEQANDDLYLIELAPGSSARLWKWIDPGT
jgi:probable phosphoglycerate mutase